MFGSLGIQELLLIFVVVLIIFGPRRIPEIGRTLGKALAEFRKATDDLKGTIEREVRLEELKQIAPQVMAPFEVVSRSEPEVVPEPATMPESTPPPAPDSTT
ncbi:MAG: twin-arginine translocase TatA/TatE family subunit [Acidobacteria bacterium]|nr:MAG: twin-arginine translocase TatA/TatE family subunit [Acidobacteriota bacterium]